MTNLLFILFFLAGIGLGVFACKKHIDKKLTEQLRQSEAELRAELEAKQTEIMELKQRFADTSYKRAELEKDCRSLKQQLERCR
jgi:uncharacterized protein HemX